MQEPSSQDMVKYRNITGIGLVKVLESSESPWFFLPQNWPPWY